jgi:thiamine biosynthesis protein ThiS
MNEARGSKNCAMAAESIRISINGENREMPAPGTVAGLLAQLRVPEERVAIELNKTIVRKRDWASTAVADGAQVEIVEFVGGG